MAGDGGLEFNWGGARSRGHGEGGVRRCHGRRGQWAVGLWWATMPRMDGASPAPLSSLWVPWVCGEVTAQVRTRWDGGSADPLGDVARGWCNNGAGGGAGVVVVLALCAMEVHKGDGGGPVVLLRVGGARGDVAAVVVSVTVARVLGLSFRAPGTPLDVPRRTRVVRRGWGASQGRWVPMLPLVTWHLVGPMLWRDGALLEPLASPWVCGEVTSQVRTR